MRKVMKCHTQLHFTSKIIGNKFSSEIEWDIGIKLGLLDNGLKLICKINKCMIM